MYFIYKDLEYYMYKPGTRYFVFTLVFALQNKNYSQCERLRAALLFVERKHTSVFGQGIYVIIQKIKFSIHFNVYNKIILFKLIIKSILTTNQYYYTIIHFYETR